MFFCLFFLQHTQATVDWGTACPPHFPMSGCINAYKRESGLVFPYINKKFTLFIAIFRTDVCAFVYFSNSTHKLQSIEAQHPLPISPCLGVVARTNESQVGFLPYINKMCNLFIAIFRTDICSFVYILTAHPSYSRLRHSIPFPFPHVPV